jgi:predicted O-methyltransferase YrrM
MGKLRPWISFYQKAETIYRTHSPFLYDLYENVLKVERYFYDFEKLEHVRRKLLGSDQMIDFEDFGAGSKILKSEKRMVSDIAKHGISSNYQCRVLFNLINYIKPVRSLELGTSLGISALYMASARKTSQVDTVDANEQLSKIASQNAKELELPNIHFNINTFEKFVIQITPPTVYDFLYIDGNHTYNATINTIEILQPFLSDTAVVMIDDIHWSEEMYQAWELLKSHRRVNSSIETQYFGLLFFDKKLPCIHHVHIEYWKKPWQIGLFS